MFLRIWENNRLELEFDHALTQATRFRSSSLYCTDERLLPTSLGPITRPHCFSKWVSIEGAIAQRHLIQCRCAGESAPKQATWLSSIVDCSIFSESSKNVSPFYLYS